MINFLSAEQTLYLNLFLLNRLSRQNEEKSNQNKGTFSVHATLFRKRERSTILMRLFSLFTAGVQDPQHEKIITVTSNGSIHSPKFPHTYPRNTVLVWRLVAVDENVWIQLTFDERFGLEDPEDDICK